MKKTVALLQGWELGPRVAKTVRAEYDYMDDEQFEMNSFFRFAGSWYSLDDFIRYGYPGPSITDENGMQASNGYIAIGLHPDDDEKIIVQS